MALPDQVELLCMAVEKMATAEAKKILEEARSRHDRMLRQQMNHIKMEQEEQKLYLKRQAYQDARRKVDAAELKARRMVMAAREEIFSRILEDGKKKLDEIRKDSSRYVELLVDMISKAARIILGAGGTGIDIRLSARDLDLSRRIMDSLSPELKEHVKISDKPAEIQGGIMAFSRDGKQLVDLSFEAIIERIEPVIRAMAAERLFSRTGAATE